MERERVGGSVYLENCEAHHTTSYICKNVFDWVGVGDIHHFVVCSVEKKYYSLLCFYCCWCI